ncbi:phosphoadenosine phosphosulfate reductase family protein [Candidatus Gottesmanbacteria bacterium]|nr:phosphoadenosine phosphosulfate reductase family protein [Candidatus Gottesmanbacteria bacterium]
MKSLNEKIAKAHSVIKEATQRFNRRKVVAAWTGGKDSTVLLHLIRTHFNGSVPFPVMFNDSTMEFDEIYEFVGRIAKEWRLQLVVVKHDEKELAAFHGMKDTERKKELVRMMKIHALDRFQKEHGIQAYIAGIRWDEHPARSKESFVSPRKDHMRIHPILHFTESDIWNYIKTYDVPYVRLYDQGYRSLGEKPFTAKAKKGEGERSGRDFDKEQQMDKLRAMGYW